MISVVSRTRPSGLRRKIVGPGARASSARSVRPIASACSAAAFGQGGILGALHAPLGVPRRLAVAQHVERSGECHDACAQDHDLGRPIASLVDRLEARRRHDVLVVRQLDGDDGARRHPAGVGQRRQRGRGMARAIGRIEEDEVAGIACRAAAAWRRRAPPWPRPVSPSLRRFSPISLIAVASLSRKVACAAPRDSASRPSAPEPAKASSTRASISGEVPSSRQLACTRMLNSASRARLAVGRVASPSGAASGAAAMLAADDLEHQRPPLVRLRRPGLGLGPARLARRPLDAQQVVERLRRDLVDAAALAARPDGTARRRRGSGAPPAGRDGPARGAPRGSCPRPARSRARRWSAAGGRAWPGWRRSARPRW